MPSRSGTGPRESYFLLTSPPLREPPRTETLLPEAVFLVWGLTLLPRRLVCFGMVDLLPQEKRAMFSVFAELVLRARRRARSGFCAERPSAPSRATAPGRALCRESRRTEPVGRVPTPPWAFDPGPHPSPTPFYPRAGSWSSASPAAVPVPASCDDAQHQATLGAARLSVPTPAVPRQVPPPQDGGGGRPAAPPPRWSGLVRPPPPPGDSVDFLKKSKIRVNPGACGRLVWRRLRPRVRGEVTHGAEALENPDRA
jgi:hypothetical protein